MNALFETSRLAVRRIETADVDAMFEVYGDRDAMKYVGDGQPIAYDACVEWVAVTHRNYDKYGYGMFAIVLKSTGSVIGFIGIVHPGGQPEPEVKYALRREVWGQGVATEAVTGLISWGQATFGLARIIATIDPENAASRRVLQKAGLHVVETRIDEDGAPVEVLATA